jgi:hypothetical protein
MGTLVFIGLLLVAVALFLAKRWISDTNLQRLANAAAAVAAIAAAIVFVIPTASPKSPTPALSTDTAESSSVPMRTVPTETAEPTDSSPNTLLETEAIEVIRQFNADQTRAVRELDLDLLVATCTDECFVEQKRYIDQLIRDNLYEVQEQLGLEVLSVDVYGSQAKVVTRETWRTQKYNRDTQQCRYHQPAFTTQQTYTLVRRGGVWKISWDNFDTPAPTDAPGC